MNFGFSGKTAIVTGGANGIGLAVSRALAQAGASVSVCRSCRREPADIARSFGARGYTADVTDRDSLERAFTQSGDPDILVASAGIAPPSAFLDTGAELWDRTLAVNLSGAFHSVQIAAKRMKYRGGGSVVLLASTNSYDGEASLTAYNASKAGLLGLLHTTANELGGYGIRVNAVCPGLIRNPAERLPVRRSAYVS